MIVIFYPQFYGIHGIARYLDSFLENLPQNHTKIILITGSEFKVMRSYGRDVEIIHIPLNKSRFSLLQWSFLASRELNKLHKIYNIDCINFHFPPLIPGLFLSKKSKLVLTAHTTYRGMSGRFYATKHFDSPWGRAVLSIKLWMERRIFSKTQHVIALTEQGRQEVLTYGFRGPITVIPNGVDLKKFTPDASVEKDIDVLFCGRIEKRKGSRPMVEICKQLVAIKPDIRICIVGYGDDDVFVREQLESLAPAVTLTGKVGFDHMLAYYNRSKVYTSTSYYEGLPGTCLEAMAMKLPVVVWDFQFYERLVSHGVTGYVVRPNDYAAMVYHVAVLLDDPGQREIFGEKGHLVLQSYYDWSSLSPTLLEIMES